MSSTEEPDGNGDGIGQDVGIPTLPYKRIDMTTKITIRAVLALAVARSILVRTLAIFYCPVMKF